MKILNETATKRQKPDTSNEYKREAPWLLISGSQVRALCDPPLIPHSYADQHRFDPQNFGKNHPKIYREFRQNESQNRNGFATDWRVHDWPRAACIRVANHSPTDQPRPQDPPRCPHCGAWTSPTQFRCGECGRIVP